MAAANLTASRLREVLHYSPDTGEFTRTESKGRPDLAGERAGWLDKSTGYVKVTVEGEIFHAHRLAWLYIYSVWPIVQIDHKDGVRSNNRLANLREATDSENNQNRRDAHKDSNSGFLGVSWCAPARKWKARIAVNGRQQHLGYFATPEQASAAYLVAKRRLHPFSTL